MKRFFVPVLSVCLLAAALIPTIASESAKSTGLSDAAKERIEAELIAMSEREVQTSCPISGNPVKEGAGFTYMGYMIGTCCPGCAGAVEKDPLTALMKLRDMGQEPALAEGWTKQEACPVMTSHPVDEEVWAVKNNMLVSFCCGGCTGSLTEDTEKVAATLTELKQAPVILTLEQKACPISGGPIAEDVFAEVEGKKVGLCCAGCKAGVEEKGAAVVQALADEGIVLENTES